MIRWLGCSSSGRVSVRRSLGLADQDDLDQLGRLGLQIADHRDLFEGLGAQVLRLVDDQGDVAPLREFLDQEFVEGVDAALLGVGLRRQSRSLR